MTTIISSIFTFIIMALILLRIIAWVAKPLIKPVAGTVGIIAVLVFIKKRFFNKKGAK